MSVIPDRLRLQRELDLQADLLYGEAEQLGAALARGQTKNAQISGMESVANSSTRVTDLLDYIKRQTAKAKRGKEWRATVNGETVGEALLRVLTQDVPRRAAAATKAAGVDIPQPSADWQELQLHLARVFVRQVAIHCRSASEGER